MPARVSDSTTLAVHSTATADGQQAQPAAGRPWPPGRCASGATISKYMAAIVAYWNDALTRSSPPTRVGATLNRLRNGSSAGQPSASPRPSSALGAGAERRSPTARRRSQTRSRADAQHQQQDERRRDQAPDELQRVVARSRAPAARDDGHRQQRQRRRQRPPFAAGRQRPRGPASSHAATAASSTTLVVGEREPRRHQHRPDRLERQHQRDQQQPRDRQTGRPGGKDQWAAEHSGRAIERGYLQRRRRLRRAAGAHPDGRAAASPVVGGAASDALASGASAAGLACWLVALALAAAGGRARRGAQGSTGCTARTRTRTSTTAPPPCASRCCTCSRWQPFFWPPGYPLLVALASIARRARAPLAGQAVSLLMGALVPVFTALLARELLPRELRLAAAGRPAGRRCAASSGNRASSSWPTRPASRWPPSAPGRSSATPAAGKPALAARSPAPRWRTPCWRAGSTAWSASRSPLYALWALPARHARARRPARRWLPWPSPRRPAGPGPGTAAARPAQPSVRPGDLRRQPAGLLVVAAERAAARFLHRRRPSRVRAAQRRLLRRGAGQPGVLRTAARALDRRRPVGRRPRAGARPTLLLIVGWAAIVYAFHAGAPWQNFRFTLAYLPPLAILVAAGLVWTWRHLDRRRWAGRWSPRAACWALARWSPAACAWSKASSTARTTTWRWCAGCRPRRRPAPSC